MLTGVAAGRLDEDRARLVSQAGIKWVRTDVTFDTTFHTTYAIAKKYKINLIGVLDTDTFSSTPSFTLDDWRGAVAKSQNSYPLVRVWEIWNEPTLTENQLGYMDGTPQHYYDMLKAAYEILKAKSSVIVLGLGGAQLGYYKDLPFARAVFSLGGGAYMDAISIHAYPYYLNIGQDWNYYKQLWTTELAEYQQFGKSFWITETGIQSNQKTEADQASYLKTSYDFFMQQGVSAYVWYQLIDYQISDNSWHMWGVVRIDLTVKPSYATLEKLA